jgi:hypothetical protein
VRASQNLSTFFTLLELLKFLNKADHVLLLLHTRVELSRNTVSNLPEIVTGRLLNWLPFSSLFVLVPLELSVDLLHWLLWLLWLRFKIMRMV